MTRATLLTIVVALATWSCARAATAPPSLEGAYTLIEENGRLLPSNPATEGGCCITLSGSVTFTANRYDLRTSHQNRNNGITFDNSEQGAYTRRGRTVTFVRTSGGGAGYPYLLGPGTLSVDGASVTLLYGDEGPGSNQIRGVFRR